MSTLLPAIPALLNGSGETLKMPVANSIAENFLEVHEGWQPLTLGARGLTRGRNEPSELMLTTRVAVPRL